MTFRSPARGRSRQDDGTGCSSWLASKLKPEELCEPANDWKRNAMGSIRGFRCRRCQAEVLATSTRAGVVDRTEWTPPVLCCGQPLRPLETGQVLSAKLPRRRTVHCPRCGFEVCIIVHPVRPLVCAICQAEFAVSEVDASTAVTGGEQLSGQTPRG